MPRYDYSSMGFYTYDCLGWPFTEVPPGGGTVFIDELTLAVSGAAGTAAIAAAKMGLNTLAVGGVGEDIMGDWVLERLRHFGVDVSAMQRKPGWRTSSSIVLTRANGTRPALHMKGATKDFFVDEPMFAHVTDAKVFHLGGVGLTEAMDKGQNAKVMKAAKAAGATTTVDVFAGSPKDLPAIADVLPYTDYFMPSIEEAQALTGMSDYGDTARFFLDMGVKACVLTWRRWRLLPRPRRHQLHRASYHIQVRCTVAAVTLSMPLMLSPCQRFRCRDALRFAQATSALNATGLGSQAGVVDYDHTWHFMKNQKTRK